MDEDGLIHLLVQGKVDAVVKALPSFLQTGVQMPSFLKALIGDKDALTLLIFIFLCFFETHNVYSSFRLSALPDQGSDTQELVFRSIIVILEDGSLNSKISTQLVGHLLTQLENVRPSVSVRLLDHFLEDIKGHTPICTGKSFELYPKILSILESLPAIPGQEQQGREFYNHFLHKLCARSWPSTSIVHLASLFRDLSLTDEQLKFALNKLFRSLDSIDLEELPAIMYQALLLSTKVCVKCIHHLLFLGCLFLCFRLLFFLKNDA
jgi:hypothetical protein